MNIFKLNDSAQRIALGLALGVFCGILPGTGPLAALFLAFLFRVNKLSALIGSILTNTWLSFVTFIFALKIGSLVFGLTWTKLYQDWLMLFKKLSLARMLEFSFFQVALPVIVGYLVVAILAGVAVYLLSLLIIKIYK
jgi:uncharacterized protein (DUF2062 family)